MKRTEQPHADEVAAGYDRGAAVYARIWNVPHPWMEEARREFGARVKAGMTLLDVGCGPGNDSAYWTSKGLKTLGVDISAKTLEGARRSHPRLEFRQLNVLDADTLGRKFDAVWMAYSLLHVSRGATPDVIRAVASCLNERGLLFIETPVADESLQTVRPIAGLKDENGRQIEVPYMLWSERDLLKHLTDRFTLEWSKIYSPIPGTPPDWSGVLRKR